MCIRVSCGYSSQTLAKVIAFAEIGVNFIGIVICMIFGAILEGRPDLLRYVAEEKPTENQEINWLLQLPHSVQTCFIIWVFTNLVAGLVFSIILLQGTHERNLTKVRLWFVVTILGHILWLPIAVLWMINSLNPLNILFQTLLSYIFGGFCLCVVNVFMEELRIESIDHRPGYKSHFLAFDKV